MLSENDIDRLTRLIAMLCGAFGREPDRATAEGYLMGLDDLPIDDVELAVKRAVRECDHMPRPAELRRLAGARTAGSQAAEAWAQFSDAWQRHSGATSLDFEDCLINATVRNLGGLRYLSGKSSDDWNVWVRKDFERVYAEYLEREPGPNACAALSGARNYTQTESVRIPIKGPPTVLRLADGGTR